MILRTFTPLGAHNTSRMERGAGFRRIIMSDVQVRAAVKAQKAAANKVKLTYRGVAYLKMPTLG